MVGKNFRESLCPKCFFFFFSSPLIGERSVVTKRNMKRDRALETKMIHPRSKPDINDLSARFEFSKTKRGGRNYRE